MAEHEFGAFEERLAIRLMDFANEAVRPFDAAQIGRVAAASAGRSWRSRLPALPRGSRPLLALALLAIITVGAGLLGGFIKLPNNDLVPNPTFQPASPLPTGPTATDIANASATPVGTNGVLPTATAIAPTPSPSLTALPTSTLSPEPTASAQVTPSPSPTPTVSPTPGPVPVQRVVAVTTGDSHACALADDGRVFCWGFNDQGQLGDGTLEYRDFGTVAVAGIDDGTAIAAGIGFSCAVRSGGSVWCWGEDPGRDESTTVPRRVEGVSDATAVAAGGAFACALRETREVACWGLNSLGQLGNGEFSSGEATAQTVPGIDDAIQLVAGWNHACVVRLDRSVWCWGGNGDGATMYGQLGDDSVQRRASPMQVAGIGAAQRVDAGGWSTCAVLTDGTAWCWGYGERGTLGDGNFANSGQPVQVAGIDDARLLALGDYTACVSRLDNSVWCWGDTSWGQSDGGPIGVPAQGNKSRPRIVTAMANDRYCLLIDGRGRTWWWGTGTAQTPERWPIGP